MGVNRVSTTISDQDQEIIMESISTIQQKLPFLVDLSPEERKTFSRLGDRNLAFTRKTLDIATQTPEFLPRSYDLEELRRDLELFESLQTILLALTKLREFIDDTAVAAGGEAYVGALEVYRYAKANGNLPGLDELTRLMGQRFAQPSRNRNQDSEVTAES
jgi:hypothetical protein